MTRVAHVKRVASADGSVSVDVLRIDAMDVVAQPDNQQLTRKFKWNDQSAEAANTDRAYETINVSNPQNSSQTVALQCPNQIAVRDNGKAQDYIWQFKNADGTSTTREVAVKRVYAVDLGSFDMSTPVDWASYYTAWAAASASADKSQYLDVEITTSFETKAGQRSGYQGTKRLINNDFLASLFEDSPSGVTPVRLDPLEAIVNVSWTKNGPVLLVDKGGNTGYMTAIIYTSPTTYYDVEQLYQGGAHIYLSTNGATFSQTLFFQHSATSWHGPLSGGPVTGPSGAVNTITYGDGSKCSPTGFILVGTWTDNWGDPATETTNPLIFASSDGRTWSDVTSSLPSGTPIFDMGSDYGGGNVHHATSKFYVVSSFTPGAVMHESDDAMTFTLSNFVWGFNPSTGLCDATHFGQDYGHNIIMNQPTSAIGTINGMSVNVVGFSELSGGSYYDLAVTIGSNPTSYLNLPNPAGTAYPNTISFTNAGGGTFIVAGGVQGTPYIGTSGQFQGNDQPVIWTTKDGLSWTGPTQIASGDFSINQILASASGTYSTV